MRHTILVLCAASVLALAACGSSGEGGELDVTLNEWSIDLDKESLPKGPIEFTIENEGEREHELVILRTEIPADELPTEDDGAVDEGAAGVNVQQEVKDIGEGDHTGRTFELAPGAYVFICNIVEDIDDVETSHYEKGMRVAFTVTEDE